jgi:hypothetical protein
MIKNWSKIVLVSMLVVAIAAPAFATTARVRSMANTGDYLSDDSNVFRWYSTLPSYANMVQAEIGTWYGPYELDGGLSDTRALGFNYACGEDGKWGTYRISLLENAVDHPGFYLVNPFIYNLTNSVADDVATPFDMTPVNKWDLGGGWEIGESVVLGVAFTRSSFKVEDNIADPVQKLSVSYTTVGLGFTWTNNEDLLFDLAFTYGSAGGDREGTTLPTGGPNKWEWDKSTGLEFGGRMFYDWKDYVTVVPLFEYMQADYSLKSSPDDFSIPEGDKIKGFMVGVGLDLEVNGSNTLIFAAEYNWAKWEYSRPDTTVVENTSSVFPTFRLALESEITAWLTTRVGALHRNVSNTYKEGQEYTWTNDSYPLPNNPGEMYAFDWDGFEWFLGCGFNVAEWTIDMELAPETPFSMGYWLTGYSAWYEGEDAGPVYRISGVYNF